MALLVVALTALLTIFVTAAPAFAHAELEGSTPAPGAVLQQPPGEVVLDFSEHVGLSLGQLTVLGPDGKKVATGKPSQRKGGSEVVLPLPDNLRDGSYLVSYRVVSADSHPVSGGFGFSIGAPSANPPTLGGAASGGASSSASEDPVVRALFGLARYAGFLGVVLLIGPAMFLLVLWPRRLSAGPLRRLVWIGWALALGGGIAALMLQVSYAAGTSLTGWSLSGLGDVINSRFGNAHLVRIGLLLAGVPLLRGLLGSRMDSRSHRLLGALTATAIIATWGWAGHAGATKAPPISVASDMVHLAAVAIWIGGLVVLATNLLPRANARELRLALPEWSRWATAAVLLLVLSGVAQTLMDVGGWSGLLHTTYGHLILIKIGLLAAILAFAGGARSRVMRHYTRPVAHAATRAVMEGRVRAEPRDPGRADLRRLRRSVLIETALAAVVLAVTSVLVQTAPGNVAERAASASAAGPYTAVMRQGDVALQVDLDPARTGVNALHLYAAKPDGSPLTVLQWTVTASLPAKGISDVNVPVQPITTSHAQGTLTLPAAGNWVFRFTARTSDIDETTIQRTIPVH